MNRWIRLSLCICVTASLALVVLPGCQDKPANPKKDEAKKEHDHPDTGPHGGPLAEWDDLYHAEFTVDHAAQKVVVYILDDKAKAAPKIDAAKISKVKLTVLETKPLLQLDLTHDPSLSSEKGIAFTVTHAHFSKAADITGTIVSTVQGTPPYNGKFTYTAPRKAELFLKPGGIYTAADVKANGNTTPEVKFKGKEWAHDDDLKPGDKICPVTLRKAEAECAWTVQGQRYEFCCPPCVGKFVGWSHFEPSKVKDAKEYVFKGM